MNISQNTSSFAFKLIATKNAVQKSQSDRRANDGEGLTNPPSILGDLVKPPARIRSAKLALFVEEYLNANFNGAKAAIAVGYSRASARVKASELLSLPEVHMAIEASMKNRAERVSLHTDAVVARMCAIAFADPRELIEIHRYCCRYCYGKDHRYQWTQTELRDAQLTFKFARNTCSCGAATKLNRRLADWSGGLGFDGCADPNPACPECFGAGVVHVVAKDTRDFSPNARALFAGAKKTKWGVDIKMNDQSAMLTNIARHLGMFTPHVTVDSVSY